MYNIGISKEGCAVPGSKDDSRDDRRKGMDPKNKLGLEGIAFQQEEERISKQKAKKLFEDHMLDTFEVGTYAGLQAIHRWLFEDVYEFAGQTRTLNIAKGHFLFASALYLEEALKRISTMPQKTFEQIVAKYIEMNIAHPFLEGNGRSTRIWLDAILRKELGKVVDWSRIDRDDYMAAMERSPVRDTEIRLLLESALTDKTEDRTVFMRSIDASYRYEGYSHYKTENV